MDRGDVRARHIDPDDDQIGAQVTSVPANERREGKDGGGETRGETIEPEEMLLDLSDGRGHSDLSVLIQLQQFELRLEETGLEVTIGRRARAQRVDVVRQTMDLQHVVVEDDVARRATTVRCDHHSVLVDRKRERNVVPPQGEGDPFTL